MQDKDLTQEQKQNLTIQAYKNVLSGEDGELVFADLRKHFSASALTIPHKTQIDPFRTHIDIGKMQVLGYIERQYNRELLEEQENEQLHE